MKKLLLIALALMAVAAPLASVAPADYAIDKTIQAPSPAPLAAPHPGRAPAGRLTFERRPVR